MPFERLSEAARNGLGSVCEDPQWYGVLRPRGDNNLTIKLLSTDTAQLLLGLADVMPLPEHVVDALGEQCDRFVAKMVLDDILAVEVNGQMLSGPAAMDVVEPNAKAPHRGGYIAALSRAALAYASALDEASVLELSQKLYFYNRHPVSDAWRQLFPTRSAVKSALGLRRRAMRSLLRTHWFELPTQQRGGWIAWQSRHPALQSGHPTFKLYVSPMGTAVASVMLPCIEAATHFGAFLWKVGGNADGLLRPDKFILYFEHFDHLKAAEEYIAERIRGCPSHGVPFTGELEPGGLLSWGIDPPHARSSVPWLGQESWRARICAILASALVVAKRANRDRVSSTRFALQRCRLEGIDTDTWTPV